MKYEDSEGVVHCEVINVPIQNKFKVLQYYKVTYKCVINVFSNTAITTFITIDCFIRVYYELSPKLMHTVFP